MEKVTAVQYQGNQPIHKPITYSSGFTSLPPDKGATPDYYLLCSVAKIVLVSHREIYNLKKNNISKTVEYFHPIAELQPISVQSYFAYTHMYMYSMYTVNLSWVKLVIYTDLAFVLQIQHTRCTHLINKP